MEIKPDEIAKIQEEKEVKRKLKGGSQWDGTSDHGSTAGGFAKGTGSKVTTNRSRNNSSADSHAEEDNSINKIA